MSCPRARAILLPTTKIRSRRGHEVPCCCRIISIESILADRAQQRTRTPTRALRVTEALSPREHSVLRSMSCGLSNKRIAQELQISPETVKSHVKGIFIKLAVQTRAHAVSTAGALGLL